jgi:hypothetical protein
MICFHRYDVSQCDHHAAEPIAECIGMCRIGEAIPHIELLAIIPPPADGL